MQKLGLSIEEKARLLAQSGVFTTLTDGEIEALSEFSDGYQYDEGETVFEHGTVARELYIVRDGTVAIIQDDQEIAQYVGNEAFGEMDLLGQAGRGATARVQEMTELLVCPSKDVPFQRLLRNEPKLAASVMHSLLSLVAGRVREANRLVSESSPWVRKLRAELYTDKLTGLYTRDFLTEELPTMVAGDSELCTVMVKPDNFKQINDTYGHAVGDAALRRLARIFRSCLDDADLGIRYLGNEFAALFPRSSSDECAARAKEIFRSMNGIDLSDILPDSRVSLTFSVAHGCTRAADDSVQLAHDRLFDVRVAGPGQLYREGDK